MGANNIDYGGIGRLASPISLYNIWAYVQWNGSLDLTPLERSKNGHMMMLKLKVGVNGLELY